MHFQKLHNFTGRIKSEGWTINQGLNPAMHAYACDSLMKHFPNSNLTSVLWFICRAKDFITKTLFKLCHEVFVETNKPTKWPASTKRAIKLDPMREFCLLILGSKFQGVRCVNTTHSLKLGFKESIVPQQVLWILKFVHYEIFTRANNFEGVNCVCHDKWSGSSNLSITRFSRGQNNSNLRSQLCNDSCSSSDSRQWMHSRLTRVLTFFYRSLV